MAIKADRRSSTRFLACGLKGAKPAPLPTFVEPCLATLAEMPPEGSAWVHEIKYDGYRVQAHVSAGRSRLYTRRGYDWTERFGPLAAAVGALPVNHLVMDGEVIATDAKGRPDYAILQADLARGRGERLVYYVFDLLYMDGFDIRAAPLGQRKRVLKALLTEAGQKRLRISEHLEGNGAEIVANACAMGLEGIVSKDRNAPYRSGRVETWTKVKCGRSDDFPIIAFVEKLGAKPRRVASLYVGRRDNGRLLYAGKARTGYTTESAQLLRELLHPYIRSTSPLDEKIKKPKATWVEPVVQAEIGYSSRTPDGLLREAVFKGVRDDLVAPDADKTAAPDRLGPRSRSPKSKPHIGVPRENILELLPDAVVPSKEQLAAYWSKVGSRALEHLGNRPLKLVRHTHRTTFYHKGKLPPVPEVVHRLKIAKREGGEGTRLWIDSTDGFLGLVALRAVELHPWNAKVDDLEHPGRIVLDLDPGEGVEWDTVTDTALKMRDILREEGLQSWPKLTGGKGIHLMAPIEPSITHDEARAFAKSLAQRILASARDRYVLVADPAERAGRIFIDYLRNGRGNTAIGTYSPRVREGFPVAAKVGWTEIENGIRPNAFSMSNPPGARRGNPKKKRQV